MRISVKYSVSGSSIDELVTLATEQWSTLSGHESLPTDTEIDVTDSENTAYDYMATVHIRLKKDADDY